MPAVGRRPPLTAPGCVGDRGAAVGHRAHVAGAAGRLRAAGATPTSGIRGRPGETPRVIATSAVSQPGEQHPEDGLIFVIQATAQAVGQVGW